MRVAIASSGLGHVHRGIEAWATDVAAALRRRGVDAHLFGHESSRDPKVCKLSYMRRTDSTAVALTRMARRLGMWRIGISNAYDVEQAAMALPLLRAVRRDFDIVHLQDPLLAKCLDRARRAGLSKARVIFANGTGEKPESIRSMSAVQELTPEARDQLIAVDRKPPAVTFMLPNFVDTNMFQPGGAAAARAKLGIAPDAFVVMTASAIRRYHKRIDYMIREFAGAQNDLPERTMLIVAGGVESDSGELIEMGKTLLGDKIRFMTGVPRTQMPDLYRAADVFVLTSLFETFGIVLLEAMATGLPIICHDTPRFRYITGPAALISDLTQLGALSAAFIDMASDSRRRAFARGAREHVEINFSETVVANSFLQMYREVLGYGETRHV